VAASPRVVIGADTHLDTIHLAAITDAGKPLADREFSTSPAGYDDALRWARSLGVIAIAGVEGTSSYGAGLTRVLQGAGVEVAEVSRPDRTALSERRAAWRSPRQASKAADGGRSSSTRVARPQPRGRDQRLRQVRRRQTGHCAVSVRRVRAGQQGRPSPIAPSYRCLGGGCRLALPLSLSWMWGSGGWER
jgi:transposase